MPFTSESYSLLDCGNGRRLERFGAVLTARPAPAADFPPALPQEQWDAANLSFDKATGWLGEAPLDWRVRIGSAVLNLRPAAGGQIGVFPEHDGVCRKIESMLGGQPAHGEGRRALNLFAHTGLATLRLAALPDMAEIVHLDAAPAAVRQAKENAAASGLEQACIRWMVDDALVFMAREVRRGRTYDIILADPPAYGRNKKSGGEWKLERDLPNLLDLAAQLLSRTGGLLCLTCHPSGWEARQLSQCVKSALPGSTRTEAQALALRPESGGHALPAGLMAVAVLNR